MMQLPVGYFVTESSSGAKTLYEDAEVYRPTNREMDAPTKEASVRSVARFPKGTPGREIEEIAKLDNRARTRTLAEGTRRRALRMLAQRFSSTHEDAWAS